MEWVGLARTCCQRPKLWFPAHMSRLVDKQGSLPRIPLTSNGPARPKSASKVLSPVGVSAPSRGLLRPADWGVRNLRLYQWVTRPRCSEGPRLAGIIVGTHMGCGKNLLWGSQIRGFAA